MASIPHSRSHGLSEDAQLAHSLLERYPDLSDQELADLIGAFKRFPLLDLGILAADEQLAEKLAAFHTDHGGKLGLSRSERVGAIALTVLILGLASAIMIGV